MPKKITTLALAALTLAGLGPADAWAAELIFPGIHPKVSAGAGQTVSRGSSALFYNPANLIFSKFIEPYLDVSGAQVNYVYKHVDDQFEPVTVAVTAPPVTAGLSLRPTPSFAIGVAVLPTGTGAEQEVEDVALELTPGTFELCNVVTKNEGMKIAAGAAFRIGHPFTLGLGVIRASEKTALLIYREASGEDPFVDALYGGESNQFVGGIRSELFDRKIALGLSYKTAVTKTYKGDVLVAVDENADFVAYEGQGYVPATIGFGAEARFGMVGVFLDVTLEQWSAGRQIAKRGIGEDPSEVDYVDAMNPVVGAKLWIAPKHMLQAAFGMYPANIGDGDEVADAATLTQEEEEGDGRVGGVTFGNLDAIPRTVAAGGYRYKLSGTGYLQGGVNYQTGAREIPEGYNQAGSYSLSVLLVGLGIAFGF